MALAGLQSPPAVALKNEAGDVVLKTGLPISSNRMPVCANLSMGKEGLFVAIGRILLAL